MMILLMTLNFYGNFPKEHMSMCCYNVQWKLEWINVYGLWLNNMTTQLLSLYNFYRYIFTRDAPLWDHLKPQYCFNNPYIIVQTVIKYIWFLGLIYLMLFGHNCILPSTWCFKWYRNYHIFRYNWQFFFPFFYKIIGVKGSCCSTFCSADKFTSMLNYLI